MFINAGARNLLLRGERQKFLAEEWPRVYANIQRLGLQAEELLNRGANGQTRVDDTSPDAAQSTTASPDVAQSNNLKEEEPKP